MLRHSKADRRRERGSIIVEVAIACVVLMVFISAIFDFAHMHYARSSLQHAVSQATRFAVTGTTIVDPSNEGKKLTREDSIRQLVENISGIRDFEKNDIQIYVVKPDGSLVAGPGSAGDVVMVRASYRIGLITPGLAELFKHGEYAFTCSTRYRNEEFTSMRAPAWERRIV